MPIALARAYRSKGLLEKADAQLTLGRPKRAALSDSSDYPYQQVELDFQLERGMVKLQRGQLAAAGRGLQEGARTGAEPRSRDSGAGGSQPAPPREEARRRALIPPRWLVLAVLAGVPFTASDQRAQSKGPPGCVSASSSPT
jgi:hypothetical protein